MFAGHDDGTISLWDLEKLELIKKLESFKSPVTSLHVVNDLLLSGSHYDGFVLCWRSKIIYDEHRFPIEIDRDDLEVVMRANIGQDWSEDPIIGINLNQEQQLQIVTRQNLFAIQECKTSCYNINQGKYKFTSSNFVFYTNASNGSPFSQLVIAGCGSNYLCMIDPTDEADDGLKHQLQLEHEIESLHILGSNDYLIVHAIDTQSDNPWSLILGVAIDPTNKEAFQLERQLRQFENSDELIKDMRLEEYKEELDRILTMTNYGIRIFDWNSGSILCSFNPNKSIYSGINLFYFDNTSLYISHATC